MNKNRWIIYTVATGIIPLVLRFLYFLFFKKIEADFIFNEGDLAAFGLMLSVSNINELDSNNVVEELWKKKKIGYSILLIIVFGSLYAISLAISELSKKEDVNSNNLKGILLLLCISTLVFSYSIYKRLDVISKSVS